MGSISDNNKKSWNRYGRKFLPSKYHLDNLSNKTNLQKVVVVFDDVNAWFIPA